MKKLLFISLILLQLNCKKECDVCYSNALVIRDTTCLDLKPLVIRRDTSFWYGYADAVKSVPGKGAIAWAANNVVAHFSNGISYLLLNTYSDTAWMNLEFWAFWRENIKIKFDPYKVDKQKIVNQQTFDKDKTLSTGIYTREADDLFDLADWDIDMDYDNYIEVTKFDQDEKIAEGNFYVHFIMKKQSTLPGVLYSKYVRFQCGKFRARIEEY